MNKLLVSFTKYSSTSGSLSKTYSLEDKTINKTPSAQMYKGTAERITMPFKDFTGALLEATSKEAFGYGLYEQSYSDKVDIVVDKEVQPEKNILSRTKKFFAYRKHPGILMLDHDPSEFGSTLTSDELIEILITLDPNIEKAAIIIRGSLSAGVHLKGKKPIKGKGFHIYIPVKDASDIPRYGKLLVEHLWLKGHGYIALGKSGNMLSRTPIDQSVFSGERIDFVGKPLIKSKGLEYTEPRAEYIHGEYLDTSELPELDAKEAGKVVTLINDAKKAIEPVSKKKRAEYKNEKIDKTVQKTGKSHKEVTKLVTKILADKHNKLWGDWILEFPEGNVTVAEALENHDQYEGKALADPIEGGAYGNTTAKFWWNDGTPIIHSFAHGQDMSYFLSIKEPKKIKEVDPYYDYPDYIHKKDACEQMEQAVEQWMTNPTGNFAIEAPAGIGKTRIILKHVADVATEKFVEIYVPTHQLANEVKDVLLEFNADLHVEVIRGRTHTNKKVVDAVTPCRKQNLIKSIQHFGYNIYDKVCKDCEFFSLPNQCDYLIQFDDATQVRIFTHQYLLLSRGRDNKIPDIAIIDEGFFTKLIDKKNTTCSLIKRYIDNKQLAEVIVDSLNNKKLLLAKLREKFGNKTIAILKDASKNVRPRLPAITSTIDADVIKNELNTGIKEKQDLSIMLNQLTAEIEKFPEREKSITVRLVNEKVMIANRHELVRFKHVFNKETIYVPVLCIDADYSNEVAEVFLPGIKNTSISVERNAYITQISSTTMAKARFIPRVSPRKGGRESEAAKNHIKNIQSTINNVCLDYGPALIVSYQDVVGNPKNKIPSKLVLPKGCKVIHLGALRGLNEFKDLETAIIIGRNQLSIDVVEAQAAAIWWDSENELVLAGKRCYEERGYTLRDTSKKIGVDVTVCKDRRAQILLQLQRECESLQAIDRIRLIHNINIKNVFILSNLPLNITVDNLVNFKTLVSWTTKIEKALMRTRLGVLPLSSEYLVNNHPDLFTNVNMVKYQIRTAGLGETIEYLLKSKKRLEFNKKEYNLLSFHVTGERGKPKKALAPKRMPIGAVKQQLKNIFKNNVNGIKHTNRGLRFEDIKPICNDDDDDLIARNEKEYQEWRDLVNGEIENYHLLPLHYHKQLKLWYVEPNRDK